VGASAKLKYHYFYRFFTYSVKRRSGFGPIFWRQASGLASGAIRSEDSVRRGV
jgi:hypothetical protein